MTCVYRTNFIKAQLHVFVTYLNIIMLKLRMEMGNVSKRQKHDRRIDNSRRSPTGLRCSEKFLHPEATMFSF